MQGEELDELMRVLEMYSHDAGRARIVAALGPVLELHREAFDRVLELARANAPPAFLARLCRDDLIGGILAGYGLVTEPVGDRAEEVLRDFRGPASEIGADLRLIEAGEDRVKVQLLGTLAGDAGALQNL